MICMIEQCGGGHNWPNRNVLQLSKGPASIILRQHMSVLNVKLPVTAACSYEQNSAYVEVRSCSSGQSCYISGTSIRDAKLLIINIIAYL